jgi:hypothetical protein
LKRTFLVFGVFAASAFYGFAQRSDSAYSRRKLSKTDIQIVYSHYLQKGNHSAVTGGIGTEELTVFSPEFNIKQQKDSLTQIGFNAGVDIITSASTDNIDFVMSSASRVDAHTYLNVSYERRKRYKPVTIGGTLSFSLESDYLSYGAAGNIQYKTPDQSRTLGAGLEVFIDDLRWGRLNGENKLKLVYPVELRNRDWFNEYKRRSFTLNTSLEQTIDRRTVLAIFPGVSYQNGLLSTPFHRVYFKDSSVRVEKLPHHRLKFPVGIQLNRFLGNRYILRTYYRIYWDEWGVVANTIELELPVKISPSLVLAPVGRMYHQTSARYFKPYQQHATDQEFYTSDYDLSEFNSYEVGIDVKLNIGVNNPRAVLNNITARYLHYRRSDGMKAHMVTMALGIIYYKEK